MSMTLAVRIRLPDEPRKGSGASATNLDELKEVLRKHGVPENLQLVGDAWLTWPRPEQLGQILAGLSGLAHLEIVTSGLPYTRSSCLDAVQQIGVDRASVQVPGRAFRGRTDPGLLNRVFEGARALAERSIAVRVVVGVDRFSRGTLDELALSAARAGAVDFLPVQAEGQEELSHLARAGSRRFEMVTAERLQAWPLEWELSRLRTLPGFDPAVCPYRRGGWPGEPPALRSVIFCEPGSEPAVYTLPESAAATDSELLWLKHALGQVWHPALGRPLQAAPACVHCLRRLDCPTAFEPAEEEDGQTPSRGASAWPSGQEPTGEMRLDTEHLSDLRKKLSSIGPGDSLRIFGRSGRLLIVDGPVGQSSRDRASDVADPQLAADLAAVTGNVVTAYGLPWETGHQTWWVQVSRPRQPLPAGPRPGQTVLMVTNVCVTRCLMCGLPDLFERAHAPAHHVLRHLAELRLLGAVRVDLFGGEVTLRHDLLGLAAFARSRGLRTSFITTGYSLDPDFQEELLGSDVDQVEVALDGECAERHNHIKGGLDVFDDATSLVRRLAEDGRRIVDVNTVILKENMEQLPRIVDLVADLGADEYRLFSCLRFGLQRGLQEPLSLDDARRIWEVIIPEARRRAETRGLHFDVCGACDPADQDDLSSFIEGRPNPMPRKQIQCLAPQSELSILIDGTVLPCQNPSFYVDPVHRPGNVLVKPLWEVLGSKKFAELVKTAGVHPSCGSCICFRGLEN